MTYRRPTTNAETYTLRGIGYGRALDGHFVDSA